MSDAAITTLVSGLITFGTLLFGFLTLWLKLRYGVQKAEEAAVKSMTVEDKIDSVGAKVADNTEIARRIREQTNGALDRQIEQMAGHMARVSGIEVEVKVIKASLENLAANLVSTRHELRGHLQTVINNLQIISMSNSSKSGVKVQPPPPATETE